MPVEVEEQAGRTLFTLSSDEGEIELNLSRGHYSTMKDVLYIKTDDFDLKRITSEKAAREEPVRSDYTKALKELDINVENPEHISLGNEGTVVLSEGSEIVIGPNWTGKEEKTVYP